MIATGSVDAAVSFAGGQAGRQADSQTATAGTETECILPSATAPVSDCRELVRVTSVHLEYLHTYGCVTTRDKTTVFPAMLCQSHSGPLKTEQPDQVNVSKISLENWGE